MATRQKKNGTVVRGGMRINEKVYDDVMKIAKKSDCEFPYIVNLALREFAEKYKGQKVGLI